jgi:hypothetical protein
MDHSGMDMGGMDMGNSTSNSTAASSSMDMGMGGASACKSKSISSLLGPTFHSIRFPWPLFPLPSIARYILYRFGEILANPSLDALELVHCRHLLPLFHLAQQYQSQIRRISHRCILPRHRHRGFQEISKGLRSTYHQASYGSSYCYEWEW